MRHIPIRPFEHYLIDALGNVYSTRKGGAHPIQRSTPLRMAGWTDGDGYKHVLLSNGAKRKRFSCHYLVAIAFIGERPFNGAQIRHLDGDPSHNGVANLAWGSAQDNSNDMINHGRSTRGAKNRNAKLSVEQVWAIRVASSTALTRASIARQFGITRSHVSKICSFKCWSDDA
jgi:hypothetical protein